MDTYRHAREACADGYFVGIVPDPRGGMYMVVIRPTKDGRKVAADPRPGNQARLAVSVCSIARQCSRTEAAYS